MGHVGMLPLVLDVAGRDSWISILLSMPIAFVFGFAIYRLRLKYPEQDIKTMLKTILGKPLGAIVNMVVISYFLFLTIFSFALYVDFVYIAFLPETPQLAIIIWFTIFFVFAAVKGIKKIALMAGILTFFSEISGHTVTTLDSPMKDWNHLKPYLEFGWSPVLWGTLIIVSVWIELLILLCVPVQNIKEKHMFLLWSVGIVLNVVMMLSTTTGCITIFGLGQSQDFLYPALESVRIISLGFIDRFDIYGLLLMSEGTFIRCSLFFKLSYDSTVTKVKSKWVKVGWFIGLLLLVFFSTNFISQSYFRFDKLMDIYVYTVFLFPLPFLLLGISYFRNRKKTSKV
jgi:spore germination protein KB